MLPSEIYRDPFVGVNKWEEKLMDKSVVILA